MNKAILPLPMIPTLFFLFFLLQQAQAEAYHGICDSTPHPNLCKSTLPSSHTDDLHYYGRFSIARSLTQARKFSKMVKKKLAKSSSSLSTLSVRALQDCDLLSDLNVDFLQSTGRTLNSSDTLLDPQAEEAQTLLSALLTNQQTCLEGLQLASSDWSLRAELASPIANDTKLFSLSLALFSHAWKKKKKKKREKKNKTSLGDIFFPLAGSRRHAKRFPSSGGNRLRKITSRLPIIVRSAVVVGKKRRFNNFTSIKEAVMAGPDDADGRNGYHVIYVTAGVYDECVEVPANKQYIMMIGDGINRTVVTGNRSVVDGWTTFNSATFAVLGRGFVAMNMTFRNTAGPEKLQAVALRNGADQSTFYRCSFEGYQDTLYTHSLRQFYRQCDVYGTVDFIFGNAAVVFQNCNLFARLPISYQKNIVTAQGRTDPNQNTGTIIHRCKIIPAPDLLKNGARIKTYLGRPWELFSRTVVMESYLGSLIDPAGWFPWNESFALSSLFYGEYDNSGPGANTLARVSWPGFQVMNVAGAANFTVSSFIAGDTWLPETGTPFLGGLS